MLDIKYIRDYPERVKTACANKNVNVDIDEVVRLDADRRASQTQLEELNRERNEASQRKDIEKGRQLKTRAAELDAQIADIDSRLRPLLLRIPNIPSDDTPIGADESGNVVLRTWGEPPKFAFPVRDHVEIGKLLGVIDSERASKVTGARFTYLMGDVARLQQALANFVMDTLTDTNALAQIIANAKVAVPAKPFTPVVPPLMIRPEVFERMGRLEPRDERYHIPSDDLYLIGSAEHTLGPIHMDETLREDALPIRYVAFTPAFRREAGSYGKDTKGILRLHQFDKIEMESFTAPEASRDEQDFFVALQEFFLQSLRIPYQVVQVCTGDMGGPDSRQIDIESWMPGQNKYRETHTSDLMTDYQARRLNTRVKRAGGTEFAHMNDATALAMGRVIIAILENYQQEDGSVAIPEVLWPYMKDQRVIRGAA